MTPADIFGKRPGVKSRMYALGRLPAGKMNKSEEAYSRTLEKEKSDGAILWWKFEGVKLRLADNTFLTPDFAVMRWDGVMELRDVKGFMMDDANVKMKVAASLYPFVFKIVRKAKGGFWEVLEVSA
jgi:hypothetical protein